MREGQRCAYCNGACGVRTIACLRPLCPWCKAPDGSLTPLGLGNLVYFYAWFLCLVVMNRYITKICVNRLFHLGGFEIPVAEDAFLIWSLLAGMAVGRLCCWMRWRIIWRVLRMVGLWMRVRCRRCSFWGPWVSSSGFRHRRFCLNCCIGRWGCQWWWSGSWVAGRRSRCHRLCAAIFGSNRKAFG